MKTYQDLVFEEVQEKDIEIRTPIMKRAFDKDANIHLGRECKGPPGYDNGNFLRKYALDEHSTSYKISQKGKVIGAIILWLDNKTNHNFLGNVFIDTKFEKTSLIVGFK